MANPTPKTSSTRVQLPVGLSGAEPPNAPEGGLAYATDTELVRVKTSTGWEDVGSGGGGGSITSIVEGPGIDITGGTGPVVTVSVDPSEISLVGDANGPLDANTVNAIHETSGPTKLTIGNINDFQLLQRVGATVVGTAYPPTTLVGDVNGPLISNQVNAIHETSGPTQLTIGSISDGNFLKRVGATVVGAVPSIPLAADITSQLAPLHWWRADNTVQSGGLVDTIVDNGSSVKSFTQTGAARCPTATDGNGNVYLALDGTTDYYTAGVAADWTFANNGGGVTIALVIQKPTVATTEEGILGTSGASSSNTGFDVVWGYTSSSFQGPLYFMTRSAAGSFVQFVEDYSLNIGKQLILIRYHGNYTSRSLGGASNTYTATDLRRSGNTSGFGQQNGTTFGGTPSFTLNLGRVGSGSEYTNCRVYEAILDNKCWTDEQVEFYEQYVGAKYGISSLIPSASDAPGGPFVSSLINTYSAKTTPVAADQIYIADSSASNAIRRSNLREVAVAGGTMYEAYPTTTDSWSDEFDFGSSDPTVRGWSVIQFYPTIAAMTRLGEVDAAIVPAIAMSAGQYRSTVRNGKLYLQVGGNAGSVMYIYKASSGAFAYATIVSNSIGGGANAYSALTLADTVSFPLASGSSKTVLTEKANLALAFQKFDAGTQVVYTSGSAPEAYRPLAMHIDWRAAVPSVSGWISSGDGELGQLGALGQTPPSSWAQAFAGVLVRQQNASERNWTVIDYIRRYPTGTFFPV